MVEVEHRRPLKTRGAQSAKRVARWLSGRRITPNQISLLSVVFAMLTAGCLLAISHAPDQTTVLLLVAAAGIQCRLLCNLFDGMVAIEGGKGTPSGELFNDIPDRVADVMTLVAAGYSFSVSPWAPAIGWAAGVGAVLTAYVRALGVATGAPSDFCGPMAKQHRMALMTFACLLSAIEPRLWPERGWILLAALVLVASGSLLTAARRAYRAYRALEAGADA